MQLNVPYLVSLPLVFQTTEEWLDSQLGVHPVQVALQVRDGSAPGVPACVVPPPLQHPKAFLCLLFECPAPRSFFTPPQVALPELDGGIEPIVFAGRDSATGKSHSLPDRIDSLCARAVNWARLAKKDNRSKKLAITVFSFPPDKGNVGTAAYLNVFGSIYRVLKASCVLGGHRGTYPPCVLVGGVAAAAGGTLKGELCWAVGRGGAAAVGPLPPLVSHCSAGQALRAPLQCLT